MRGQSVPSAIFKILLSPKAFTTQLQLRPRSLLTFLSTAVPNSTKWPILPTWPVAVVKLLGVVMPPFFQSSQHFWLLLSQHYSFKKGQPTRLSGSQHLWLLFLAHCHFKNQQPHHRHHHHHHHPPFPILFKTPCPQHDPIPHLLHTEFGLGPIYFSNFTSHLTHLGYYLSQRGVQKKKPSFFGATTATNISPHHISPLLYIIILILVILRHSTSVVRRINLIQASNGFSDQLESKWLQSSLLSSLLVFFLGIIVFSNIIEIECDWTQIVNRC